MNGEGKFSSLDKGFLDRRSSKVSPDSFAVQRDRPLKVVIGKILGNHDNEPLYDNRSGKISELQREKFESIRNKIEKVWLSEFKIKFLENLDVLRQNGDLDLSPEEVKKRMTDVQFFFFNKGSTDSKNIDAKGATSRFSSVHIEIDSDFSGDEEKFRADLQHTFNHEMFHIISGSLFLTTSQHLGFFNTEKYRTGLVFGPRINGEDVEKFGWLNEAITETLALEMDSNMPVDTAPYKSLRQLFFLLTNGPIGSTQKIDKKVFYQAYFENYESKKSTESRLQNWKKLMRSINSLYYPGFLVKIDNIIKEKGAEYVINNFDQLCEEKR